MKDLNHRNRINWVEHNLVDFVGLHRQQELTELLQQNNRQEIDSNFLLAAFLPIFVPSH